VNRVRDRESAPSPAATSIAVAQFRRGRPEDRTRAGSTCLWEARAAKHPVPCSTVALVPLRMRDAMVKFPVGSIPYRSQYRDQAWQFLRDGASLNILGLRADSRFFAPIHLGLTFPSDNGCMDHGNLFDYKELRPPFARSKERRRKQRFSFVTNLRHRIPPDIKWVGLGSTVNMSAAGILLTADRAFQAAPKSRCHWTGQVCTTMPNECSWS